jgi:hypothetical protein
VESVALEVAPDRSTAPQPGGQDAIEQVDAQSRVVYEVLRVPNPHDVARAVRRKLRQCRPQQGSGTFFWFPDAQTTDGETGRGFSRRGARGR